MKHGATIMQLYKELKARSPLLTISVTNGKQRLVITSQHVSWHAEEGGKLPRTIANQNSNGPVLNDGHLIELRRQLNVGIAKMDEVYQALYEEVADIVVLRALDADTDDDLAKLPLQDRIFTVLYEYIFEKLLKGILPNVSLEMDFTLTRSVPIEKIAKPSFTLRVAGKSSPYSPRIHFIVFDDDRLAFCLLFREINDDVQRFIDAYNTAAQMLGGVTST